MFRITVLSAAVVFAIPAVAQDKPTVELSGSLDDATLQKSAPENGVIVSKKKWEELAKAWKLAEPLPKVDFDKEIIVVATTVGSRLNLKPTLKDGDLKALAIATRDLRPGFRYAIQTFKKEGVKTVNGKELPKE